jgi:hypothetical protein
VILHLHIGGQVIRTTPEHPFYVKDQGWTPGGDLRIGDLLATHDGRWIGVDDLLDTSQIETVYNIRVSEFHTYFVGSETWGFGVWAHNAYHPQSLPATRQLGEQFRGRAQELWTILPRGKRYGATGGKKGSGLNIGVLQYRNAISSSA